MRVRGRASKHQALQKAQSCTGAHSTADTTALFGAGPQDALCESDPLALPMTGVTASSLRRHEPSRPAPRPQHRALVRRRRLHPLVNLGRLTGQRFVGVRCTAAPLLKA